MFALPYRWRMLAGGSATCALAGLMAAAVPHARVRPPAHTPPPALMAPGSHVNHQTFEHRGGHGVPIPGAAAAPAVPPVPTVAAPGSHVNHQTFEHRGGHGVPIPGSGGATSATVTGTMSSPSSSTRRVPDTNVRNTNSFNLSSSFPFGVGTLHENLSGSVTTNSHVTSSGTGNSRKLNVTSNTSTTANLSPSFTSNLTPAQQAALGAAEATQLRAGVLGNDLHELAELQALQSGMAMAPGYATMAASPYVAPGYGGAYGGGMGAGMGAGPGGAPQAAPGGQVAGFEDDREPKDRSALLTAAGVPNDEGEVRWPVALTALRDPHVAELRDRVNALLQEGAGQAADGTASARLRSDVAEALDGLRKALDRDRDERFSLPANTYDYGENFLTRLDRAAARLTEGGLNAPQSPALRTGERPPAPMPPADK